MQPDYEGATLNRIANTLLEGKVLVIFGWISKNHSNKTKEISSSKVRFFERLPSTLPQNAGLVVMTRFIGHSEVARVKSWGVNYIAQAIPIGQIKRILYALRDLLHEDKVIHLNPIAEYMEQTFIDAFIAAEVTPPSLETLVAAEVIVCGENSENRSSNIATVTEEVQDKDITQQFIAAFQKEAASHAEKIVSSHVLAKMLREQFPGLTAATLVSSKMIEPVRIENKKKTGWYRLVQTMTPEDQFTISKMERILAQEERLKADLAAKQAEVKAIRDELARIRRAREVIKNLKVRID